MGLRCGWELASQASSLRAISVMAVSVLEAYRTQGRLLPQHEKHFEHRLERLAYPRPNVCEWFDLHEQDNIQVGVDMHLRLT